MPVNDNKVRVTKLFGGGSTVGVMDGKVGMTVRHDSGSTHTIVAIHTSGLYQYGIGLSGAGPEVAKAYGHQLFVEYPHATSTWSYPTGDGSYAFSHVAGILSGGSPVANPTGMIYFGGDGVVHTIAR